MLMLAMIVLMMVVMSGVGFRAQSTGRAEGKTDRERELLLKYG